jgi:hypothetical protein
MALLLILFCIWGTAELVRMGKEERRKKELARIKAEQERQKRQARELAIRQREMAKEQAEIEKEQRKQAAVLERHEQRITELEYKVEQATADMAHWKEQLSLLYAILDEDELQQSGLLPGSKEFIKAQNKIITISNKIHSAETKYNKAKHIKAVAEQELSA